MERQLTVEFGPSRSKRFAKAVAEAQSGPGECRELEPGSYRVRFVLNEDATLYTGLARVLEGVRHWRATEVYQGEEQVSPFHARDIEVAGCPNPVAAARLPDGDASSDSGLLILERSPGQTLSSLSAARSRRA